MSEALGMVGMVLIAVGLSVLSGLAIKFVGNALFDQIKRRKR